MKKNDARRFNGVGSEQSNYALGVKTSSREVNLSHSNSGTLESSILLVDDADAVRCIYSYLLETEGFSIVSACDGKEALEKMRNHRIKLVITDLNMPRLNGIELTQALKKDPDCASIPIIMITAEPDAIKKEELENIGIDFLWAKSDPFDHLLLLIRYFMS